MLGSSMNVTVSKKELWFLKRTLLAGNQSNLS